MERLNLMEPPINTETYSLKGLFSRRRFHQNSTMHDWMVTLADKKTLIRWIVPWWNIRSMIFSDQSPYIRVAGLTTLTFYCPSRVMRQYGKRRVIPDHDSVRPDDKPILGGIAQSWEKDWGRRSRITVSALSEAHEKVSKHYLIWMTADTFVARAEARNAERRDHDLGKGRGCEESKAPSVKDRLGPRRVAVWDRLEKLPPLRIDEKARKGKKRARGESKATGEEKMGDSKKKWVLKKKKDGETASELKET